MKNIVVAVLMLLASANALPSLTEREVRQERIINDIIIGVIEDLIQRILERGLDPFVVPSAKTSFALSEPEVFSVDAWVEEFVFSGLSKIEINSIDFSILSQTLSFDLSLPGLFVGVGEAGANINTFGRDISGRASGDLSVEKIRLTGAVRVSIGAVTGISVRSISLSFSLGGINANLNINLLGRDVSEVVNNYLSVTLPNALKESRDEINNLLEYLAWYLVERFLDFSSLNMALQA